MPPARSNPRAPAIVLMLASALLLGGCSTVPPNKVAASALGAASLATGQPQLGLLGAAIGFVPMGEPELRARDAYRPRPWGGSNASSWEAVYARPVAAKSTQRWTDSTTHTPPSNTPTEARKNEADPPVPAGLH